MLIILFRNDGTGDAQTGNYEVTVRVNQFELERTRIEGHKRADGWRELVRMLVDDDDEIEPIGASWRSRYAGTKWQPEGEDND